MMKRNRFYRFTAAAAALSILIPPSALAAAPSVQTDETVYINLDYYGSKIDTRIVKGVDLNGHRQFHDYGNYASVFNMSTFDEPDQSSPGIVKWNIEDETLQRFYFECVPNDEAPIILPWDFDVSYKLNGVPVEAEQCAGASGLIQIDIRAEPNRFASEYYQNNMILACVTGIDMSKALSIDAPGAQVQSMGTYKIVCFAGLPGQEDTFTIRIGSDCFESMGMMFFMAPATLSALDILTDIKENVDDLKEIRDRFTASNDQFYAGLSGVLSTADNLKGGLDILSGGVTGIDQVRKQMINSRTEIDPAIDTALTALEELAGNSDSIMPALQQLNTVLPTLNDTTGELLNAMRQTGVDIPRYQELLNVLYQDLSALQNSLDDFHSINHSSDDMIAFSDACEAIRLDMDVLSFQLMMMDGSLDNIETIKNVINKELQNIRDKINNFKDKTPNDTPNLPNLSDKLPGFPDKFPDLLDKITNIPDNLPDLTDKLPSAPDNTQQDNNNAQIETQEIVNPIPEDEATESVSDSSSDGGDGDSSSTSDSSTSGADMSASSDTNINTNDGNTSASDNINDTSTSNDTGDTGGGDTSAPSDTPTGGDDTSAPSDPPTSGGDTSTPSDPPTSGGDTSTPSDPPTGGDDTSAPSDSPTGGDDTSAPSNPPTSGDENTTPPSDSGTSKPDDTDADNNNTSSSDPTQQLKDTLAKLQQLWNDINATVSNITGRISGVTSILSDMTQDTGSVADLLAVGESIGLNMSKILKTLEENENVADNFVVDGQEFSDLLSGTLSDIGRVLDYLPDLSNSFTELTNTTTNIIDETTNVAGSLRDSINTMLLTTEQALTVSKDTLRSLRRQADDSAQQSINGLLDVLQKTIASNNTSTLQSASDSFHQAINDTNKDLDEMEQDLEDDTKFLNIDSAADIQSVTSLLNPAPSSLQFILRTKEISIDEVEEAFETDSAAEDEGVAARIQNIFRKLYEAITGVFVSE